MHTDKIPKGTVKNAVMSIESRFGRAHSGAHPAPVFNMRSKRPVADMTTRTAASAQPATPSLGRADSKLKPAPTEARGESAHPALPSANPASPILTAGQALQLSLGDTWDQRATLRGTPPQHSAFETGDLCGPKICYDERCRIHRRGVSGAAVLRCSRTKLINLLQYEIQYAYCDKRWSAVEALERKLKELEDLQIRRDWEEAEREAAEREAWLLTQGREAKMGVSKKEVAAYEKATASSATGPENQKSQVRSKAVGEGKVTQAAGSPAPQCSQSNGTTSSQRALRKHKHRKQGFNQPMPVYECPDLYDAEVDDRSPPSTSWLRPLKRSSRTSRSKPADQEKFKIRHY